MSMLRKLYGRIKADSRRKIFKKKSLLGHDVVIGEKAICHSDKKDAIKIGDHSEIWATLVVQGNGRITVGPYSWIGSGTIIGALTSIEIGSHAMISTEVHIYDNNNHPTDPRTRTKMCEQGFHGDAWQWYHSESAPIVIGNNVWIGERSTILKGVSIGDGAIIAAASVVTHDVPAYSIAAGNPAHIVKKLPHPGVE